MSNCRSPLLELPMDATPMSIKTSKKNSQGNREDTHNSTTSSTTPSSESFVTVSLTLHTGDVAAIHKLAAKLYSNRYNATSKQPKEKRVTARKNKHIDKQVIKPSSKLTLYKLVKQNCRCDRECLLALARKNRQLWTHNDTDSNLVLPDGTSYKPCISVLMALHKHVTEQNIENFSGHITKTSKMVNTHSRTPENRSEKVEETPQPYVFQFVEVPEPLTVLPRERKPLSWKAETPSFKPQVTQNTQNTPRQTSTVAKVAETILDMNAIKASRVRERNKELERYSHNYNQHHTGSYSSRKSPTDYTDLDYETLDFFNECAEHTLFECNPDSCSCYYWTDNPL